MFGNFFFFRNIEEKTFFKAFFFLFFPFFFFLKGKKLPMAYAGGKSLPRSEQYLLVGKNISQMYQIYVDPSENF